MIFCELHGTCIQEGAHKHTHDVNKLVEFQLDMNPFRYIIFVIDAHILLNQQWKENRWNTRVVDKLRSNTTEYAIMQWAIISTTKYI